MAENESFPTMMRKLSAGDSDAQKAVFDLYVSRLIRMADKRQQERFRSKFGGDDVANTVFRTFFRQAAEGKFKLGGENELLMLLAGIARRKSFKYGRHFDAAKRGGKAPHDGSADYIADDSQPTPDAVVTFLDDLETLFRSLSEREQVVCVLWLQGFSAAEIGERIAADPAGIVQDLRSQGYQVAGLAESTGTSPANIARDIIRIKQLAETLLPAASP